MTNFCYAFSELYYIKNSDKAQITDIVETSFVKKSYIVQQMNPYYAFSAKNANTYAKVVIEPYGQQYLYYYESNNDKKLNKEILKSFDDANVIYEKSFNEVSIKKVSEMAQSKISGETKDYSFDNTPAPVYQTQTIQKVQTPPTTLKGFVGKVGKGAILNVYLQNPINTATANVGDSVIGVLKSDWVSNSRVIAQQGSILTGVLTEANHARFGMRNGGVQISFNKLDTPDGKTYDLVTEKIDFNVSNDGVVQKTLTSAASAAAVGALVGLAVALLSSNHAYARDIGIGAGISGGLALATTVMQNGVDAEIPAYTDLEVVLDEDINVVIY